MQRQIIRELVDCSLGGPISRMLQTSAESLGEQTVRTGSGRLLTWLAGRSSLVREGRAKTPWPLRFDYPAPHAQFVRPLVEGNVALLELFEVVNDRMDFRAGVSAAEQDEIEAFVKENWARHLPVDH